MVDSCSFVAPSSRFVTLVCVSMLVAVCMLVRFENIVDVVMLVLVDVFVFVCVVCHMFVFFFVFFNMLLSMGVFVALLMFVRVVVLLDVVVAAPQLSCGPAKVVLDAPADQKLTDKVRVGTYGNI